MRAARKWTLTGFAALLVLLVLTLPGRLEEIGPGAFLRLPIEVVVLLAVAVAIPPRLRRLRVALAVTAGLVLGLVAVLRLLDLGFLQALDRPFDPLIDWHYAASSVETLRSSVGETAGTVLAIIAVLAAVAVLLLLPWALVRLSGVAAAHRRRSTHVLLALATVWVMLAAVDLSGRAGPLAARNTARYVYAQVTRIPTELRDQREFAGQVEKDEFRTAAPQRILADLRGKDVLFVFVESYGRVAVDGSSGFSREINAVLDDGTRQLRKAGYSTRSAFLTSPTFGGLSWLAHSTLQSGLWVNNEQRYDVLLSSSRLTLTRLFRQAGWRTVGDVPANRRNWARGRFYGFKRFYDSRNVGYRGPTLGYAPVPDQYTLQTFYRLELKPRPRPPVMAEIDLVTSHAPWSRTPPMLDWADVGNGSVYNGMEDRLPSREDIWTSPERIQDAYGESIEYSLRALVGFIETYGNDDLVVVFLGDHQPATIVSGRDASHDVPIAIVSRDQSVLAPIKAWGWGAGLRPRPDAPVLRMDRFRDRFLTAYGSRGQSGSLTAGAR